MVKSWLLGNGTVFDRLPLGLVSPTVAENKKLPPSFSCDSSFCISSTEVPLETFMKPKKALEAACAAEGSRKESSQAAPQRLMDMGALAGSEPITNCHSDGAALDEGALRRM